MNRNLLITLAVLALAALGGWYFFSQRGSVTYSPTTPEQTPPSATIEESSPSSKTQAEEITVNVTSAGFSPSTVTVKAGGTVTWMNNDSVNHQVNSAVHPTHQLYPPLNTVGLVKPEESKSLQFPAAGTYKYHDHLNPSLTGTVIVE